ncbi:MAG: DUF3300 domain-containing protein [Syntrophobacteraceae bacterium]
MNPKAFLMRTLVGVLILVLAVPPGTFAQSSDPGAGFTEEELDQMLAPIALYPDSLLAQVLVAATYPEQIAEADQWAKANSGLQGDRVNDALDRMEWDLSVKALVPFPKVLEMMHHKRDWTLKLGEAFLAQEAEVMDSVQKLRSRAHAHGSLKSTSQQKVVVKGQSIEILPANPQVVYVPAYNPVVVYGPWWYPSYPPYAWSPYYPSYVYDPYYSVPGFIAVGALGFAAAITVGSFWHRGWGRWDWGRRDVVVNVNRTININRTNIRNVNVRTTSFNRAVRQGRIGSPAVRNAARVGPGQRATAASTQRELRQRQIQSGQRRAVQQGRQAGQRGSVQQGRQAGQAGQRRAVQQGRQAGQRGSVQQGRQAGQRGSVQQGRQAGQAGQRRAVQQGRQAGQRGSVQQGRQAGQRRAVQQGRQAGSAGRGGAAVRGGGGPRGGAAVRGGGGGGAARGGGGAARGGGGGGQRRGQQP